MSATMYPHESGRSEAGRPEPHSAPGGLPRSRAVLASIRVDGTGALRDLRAAVQATAQAAGLSAQRVADMALAVNEIATNAILHGGGTAAAQIWMDDGSWHCDVTDDGPGLPDPALGTQPPGVQEGGFGLWIARRLCDRFEVLPREPGAHLRLSASR